MYPLLLVADAALCGVVIEKVPCMPPVRKLRRMQHHVLFPLTLGAQILRLTGRHTWSILLYIIRASATTS